MNLKPKKLSSLYATKNQFFCLKLDFQGSQLSGIDQWLKNVNEAVSQVNQEIKDLQTHIISASKND